MLACSAYSIPINLYKNSIRKNDRPMCLNTLNFLCLMLLCIEHSPDDKPMTNLVSITFFINTKRLCTNKNRSQKHILNGTFVWNSLCLCVCVFSKRTKNTLGYCTDTHKNQNDIIYLSCGDGDDVSLCIEHSCECVCMCGIECLSIIQMKTKMAKS